METETKIDADQLAYVFFLRDLRLDDPDEEDEMTDEDWDDYANWIDRHTPQEPYDIEEADESDFDEAEVIGIEDSDEVEFLAIG